MNFTSAHSDLQISISKLSASLSLDSDAEKQNDNSVITHTDLMRNFDELLHFLQPTSVERSGASAGSIKAASRSTAEKILGATQARQNFSTLSVRRNLLTSLQAASSASALSDEQRSQTQKICRELIHDTNSRCKQLSLNGSKSRNRREAIEKKFSELLDFMDIITLLSKDAVLEYAKDYSVSGRAWRARRLLTKWLRDNPEDVEAHQLLGNILLSQERFNSAVEHFENAIEQDPGNWRIHRDLGLANMRSLQVSKAVLCLVTAQAQKGSSDESLDRELRRAKRMRQCIDDAESDRLMPAISLEPEEIEQGFFHAETLSLAAKLYTRYGTLCLENAFDPEVIKSCREQFMAEYTRYFSDSKHDDALQIGDRRFQVSIALQGSFNQSGLYANPFVLALMKKLIGPDVIIGSTVCATSLPGAKDQHLHKDHHALFARHVDDKPISIPPVAITTMIPLVALDEKIGSTMVKKGSHLASRKASADLPYQTPIVSEGGCFFMDLALSHKGQGNSTQQIRPIVNMVYSQHWFADNRNFKLQPPLQISPAEFARIEKKHRPLVDWAVQPGPQVNR